MLHDETAVVNALILGGASVVTGLIVGGWLMATVATAAIGRAQDRMQRKVDHWRERAMRAENPDRRRPTAVPDDTLRPVARA